MNNNHFERQAERGDSPNPGRTTTHKWVDDNLHPVDAHGRVDLDTVIRTRSVDVPRSSPVVDIGQFCTLQASVVPPPNMLLGETLQSD